MKSEEKFLPVSFTFKATFESDDDLRREIEHDICLINEKIEKYRKSIGIKMETSKLNEIT